MTNENDENLYSQLADGELPSDQLNELLLGVLDDSDRRESLRGMLQLRQSLRPWRDQQPPLVLAAPPPASPAVSVAHQGLWWSLSLAAAALLGGVLVGLGFWMGGRGNQIADNRKPDRAAPAVLISTEQMRDIAHAFALHESVAGPLNWYAADETNIEVAPVGHREPVGKPIAVLLRLSADKTRIPAKTYVIVCRQNGAATIELPGSQLAGKVRLRLVPTTRDDKVELQYALTASGPKNDLRMDAALAGVRSIGRGQTTLGQLAFDGRIVKVDASAWIIKEDAEIGKFEEREL